jgi:hypothetical protein
MLVIVRVACALWLLLALSSRVHAHDTVVVQSPCTGACGHTYQAPPPYVLERHVPAAGERPSAFRSGFRGLIAGGLGGLGAGYLVARGADGDAYRPLAFGAGVGALAGAGLGVSLGLLDGGTRGTGYYVARDMLYGVLFGAGVGAVAGGLSVLLGSEGERVLLGTAVGALGGLGVGLIAGFIEGSAREHDRYARRRVALSMAPTSGGFVSGVTGHF